MNKYEKAMKIANNVIGTMKAEGMEPSIELKMKILKAASGEISTEKLRKETIRKYIEQEI